MTSETTPQPTWTLEELKSYLQSSTKKMALHGWHIGKALQYAQEIVERGKPWITIMKEACPGLSIATLNRYLALARRVKDPAKLTGKKLNEAYESAGITTKKKKAPPQAKTDAAAKKETAQPQIHVSQAVTHLAKWNALPVKDKIDGIIDGEAFRKQLNQLISEAEIALNSLAGSREAA